MLGAHAVGFRISAIHIPRWHLASGTWGWPSNLWLSPRLPLAVGRRPSASCFRPLASSYWAHAVDLGLAAVGVRCFPVGLWCLQFWRWSMSPWLGYRSLLEFGLYALRLRFYVVLQFLGSWRWHLTFGLGLSSFRQLPVAFSVLFASLPFSLGVCTCAFGVCCWPLRLFQFCLYASLGPLGSCAHACMTARIYNGMG